MSAVKVLYLVKILTIIICFIIKLSDGYRSEILYNLAELYGNNLKINENCRIDLKHVIEGVDNNDIWALKLLDASGRRESGFVWGNNYWLGSKVACDIIETPVTLHLSKIYKHINHMNLTENATAIPVEYRVVYARHHPKLQVDTQIMDRKILHMGFCFPQSCSNEDTLALTSEMFTNSNFSEENFLGHNTTAFSTKTLMLRDNFYNDIFFKIMISIFIVNIVCVIIGSVYISYIKYRRTIESKEIENNNDDLAKKEHKLKPGAVEKFFRCFSIVENAKIIASKNVGRESIQVIHGIRTYGMIYIIFGHIFVYTISGNNNFEAIFLYSKDWMLQPVFSVALSVDTYFMLSALLLSYAFFQRVKTEKPCNPVISAAKGIINRYLRLTPSYCLVMVITTVMSKFLRDTSQFWSLENNDENCSKYWWRNLLYINNFYPASEMCMSWSWYLAVDFQCFVIATILFNLYKHFKKLSISLFGLIFISATIYNGYNGYLYSYSYSVDTLFNTMDYLYTPAVTRITAYIVGVWTGWFLSECKSKKEYKLNQKMVTICWILGPILNMALIYGNLPIGSPIFISIFYPALSKTLWAIGISWVVIACTLGHGGIIAKILNAKYILPFSRMTYSVYLINPLLIIYIIMSTDVSFHLDFSSLAIQSMGLVTLSFILSYIFMLFFENPFVMLIRTYIEKTIKY